MKRFLMLVPTLGMALPACSASSEVLSCPPGYEPISTKPPSLLKETENDFRGDLEFVVLVDTDGSVKSVKLDSSALKRAGSGRNESSQYEDAARKALLEWRFPRVSSPCEAKVSMTFESVD
ncbi:hypothetical protein [Pseudoxanthomonas sp.]|uniref:hypothetical protein n=1 Tax=Pseudoxanthomonas sp. TaxID=1871049 RepID=UPI003F7CF440